MDNTTLEKEYREAMRNVPVQKNKLQAGVEKRLVKTSVKRNYWKAAAACVIVLVLVMGLLPDHKSAGLVLTVYAEDGTANELGKDGITIKKNASVIMSGYSKNSQGEFIRGSEVFLFLIGCEDDEVKRITYRIEGEYTADSLQNMGDNQVWFSEQLTIDEKEYAQRKAETNGPGIYKSLKNTDSPIYTAYSYIGSSYSVEAEKQYEKDYCIEFKTSKGEAGWYAKAFSIDVSIEMKDGTFAEKKLCCQPVVCGEYDEGIPAFELRIKEI